MSITVRYAECTELDRVNELRQMVNALHAAGRPDIFRPDFCEELRQSVYRAQEAPDADVIVACLDGVVCGFAVVQYMDRPASAYQCARRYYHIEEFGVDAAFRRRGVGAALIDFCRQEAARMQFARVELDVWSFNEDAQRFYEAIGFETYRRLMELSV